MIRYAIVVTDRQLLPPFGGNRVRILGLIRAFRALGWRVGLVTSQTEHPRALRECVEEIFPVAASPFPGGDLKRFSVDPYRRVLERFVRARAPEVVIAEYAWLAPAMWFLPPHVQRWVDCHDLLHERTSRFRAAGLDPWTTCTREEEIELLARADVIIASQRREADLLAAMLPSKRIICLLPGLSLPNGYAHADDRTGGRHVLLVGAQHAGNDAIVRFVREAWPSVLQHVPDARLQIVGAIGRRLTSSAGVEVFCDVDDLFSFYRKAAVVVCPVLAGTGVKIKMIEALRAGSAVVATAAAAEGLPDALPPAWITVDSLRDAAGATAALLLDVERQTELASAAHAYGERYLSDVAFQRDLRSILPRVATRWLRQVFPSLLIRRAENAS